MDQNFTSYVPCDDVPPLPSGVRFATEIGADACPWLDDYITFSRMWAPRAYAGFHEVAGLWVLSTIASRRVYANLGRQRFTNLYLALIARTSMFTKSTITGIATDTIREAGLSWLLAPDLSTPQRFLSDLGNNLVVGYDSLNQEEQSREFLRATMPGQRGWFFEEFGQQVRSMMAENGFMADFRSILRRLDDTPPEYRNATIGRGLDVIRQPYLALLCNLTPDDLRPFARRGSALWGDGFLARFALITPPGNSTNFDRFPLGERIIPSTILTPLQHWHQSLGLPEGKLQDVDEKDHRQSARRVVASPLRPIQLGITPTVFESFYNYHDALVKLTMNFTNADLDGNYARFAEKAIRIAILFASLAGNDRIELTHWARAQEISERWRLGLHTLYAQLNFRKNSLERDQEDDVLRIVNKLVKPTAVEVARYIRDMTTYEVSKVLDRLVDVGVLQIECMTRRKTKRYRLSDDRQET